MMTPRDHMSQDLSYFSGPSTSGAGEKRQTHGEGVLGGIQNPLGAQGTLQCVGCFTHTVLCARRGSAHTHGQSFVPQSSKHSACLHQEQHKAPHKEPSQTPLCGQVTVGAKPGGCTAGERAWPPPGLPPWL